MQPIILLTDALIYTLLFCVIIFACWSIRYEHLRAPWRQVIRNRLGCVAMVILSFYVIVGILDSIHFRSPNSLEVESALDRLVYPLSSQDETTYSAPFATHLFNKETRIAEKGGVVRDYPRLKFAGQHLANPEQDKNSDIFYRILLASSKAAIAWLFLTGIWLLLSAKKNKQTLQKNI